MKLKRKINVLVNTSLVRGLITSPSLEVLVLRINAVQRSEDSIELYLRHLEREREILEIIIYIFFPQLLLVGFSMGRTNKDERVRFEPDSSSYFHLTCHIYFIMNLAITGLYKSFQHKTLQTFALEHN